MKYYEIYIEEKYVYLVTEYVDGEDVFDRLNNEHDKFTEQEAKKYMKTLLSACSHIHVQGVAHRDIKPENILFSKKDGKLKLVEFDMSKKMEEG